MIASRHVSPPFLFCFLMGICMWTTAGANPVSESRIGDFTVHWTRSADGNSGIGKITAGNRELRAGDVSWTFYAETLDGHRFDRWTLNRVDAEEEGLVARLTSTASRPVLREKRNVYGDPLVSLQTGPVSEETATLKLVFASDRYLGLPRLRVRAELETSSPVDFLLERYSLELDGTTEGATFFAQRWGTENGGWQSSLDEEAFFSTEDAMFVNGKPHSLGQLQPRLAGGVAMEYFWKADGAVAAWREEGGLTKSVSTKPKGSGRLEIIEKHFAGRGQVQTSPWLNIVVYDGRKHGELDESSAHDLWARLWDAFADGLNRRLGIDRPDPVPSLFFESWNLGSGRFFEHQAAQLDYIETTGVRRVMLHTLPHPHLGHNCCALHGLEILESEGGMEALAGYVKDAKSRGLEVYGWATAMMLKEGYANRKAREAGELEKGSLVTANPDWFCRDRDGNLFGSGYQELATYDLTHPDARAYFVDWMKRFHQEAGLDGMWADSFINAWATPLDYSDGGANPVWPGSLKALAESNAGGMKFVTEGVSPIATSAGNLGMWEDLEGKTTNNIGQHMNVGAHGLYRTTMWVRGKGQEAGKTVTPAFYFQSLANKAPLALMYHSSDVPFNKVGTLRLKPVAIEGYADMNRAYLEVLDLMGVRQLLLEQEAVLWHPAEAATTDLSSGDWVKDPSEVKGPRVLFTFTEREIELPGNGWAGRTLRKVGTRTSRELKDARVQTEGMSVYIIE